MEIWDNKLLFSGYFWRDSDRRQKIWSHEIGGSGIQEYQVFNVGYESIFKIWVRDGVVLNCVTEQPPDHWAREKVSGWGLQKHFNDFGWAVLGDSLENGESVRGWSSDYRDYHGPIEICRSGQWQNLGNPVRGLDNSNRISWCVEKYNNEYYTGTAWAENGGCLNQFCGNIYKLIGNDWKPVYGHEINKPCGSVLCCSLGDNRIFFGTAGPQRIIIFDGNNWTEQHLSDNGEIAKIFKDKNGNIFAGGLDYGRIFLLQWNYKTKKFENIWEKQVNNASNPPIKDDLYWGVVGICIDNASMFIKYRCDRVTKIVKLTYA
jgi:hypothetical protein